MLNRRYIRIKVLQALYSFFSDDEDTRLEFHEKELLKSANKIYELYIYLLLLLCELRRAGAAILEERSKKLLKTAQDINPDLRFIDNPVFIKLANSKTLLEEKKRLGIVISAEDKTLIKQLYHTIEESGAYTAFMAAGNPTYEDIKKSIVKIYKKQIGESELIKNEMLVKNIHWTGDIVFINLAVIRTLGEMDENREFVLTPLYRQEEDKEFMLALFRQCILNNSSILALIKAKLSNWNPDRLAVMDLILMKMAITEILYLPYIPVKVSLNEYIDLSKTFSSPDSSAFINGNLNSIVHELKKSNKVLKTGKGLIE
jgi:N utilization substance protein B